MLTLFPLLMVIFLDVMGILLVLPVFTPLLLQSDTILHAPISLAWRDFYYGLSLAVFPLFMFFSTPILGDLSDRFGRKKILLICLIISACSYIISAIGIVYQSLALLLISRSIAGLAAGTQPIASAAMIDMSTPKTKTRYLSWVVLVGTVGAILGPVLGGLTAEKNLSHWFSYQTPFILAAVLGFLNAIFLYYTFKETQTIKSNQPIRLLKGFLLFFSAFAQPKFRLLVFSTICYFLAWSLYFQMIGWFMMKVHRYTEGQIGIMMGFIALMGAIGLAFIMRILLNLFASEKQVYLFLLIMMTISNIGCALSHSELSQWLWLIPNAMADTICYTLVLSLFSNLVDSRSQGWIMGIVGAIGAITWSLGGLLVGPLGFIHIRAPFWSAGILCGLSFLLAWINFKKSV